MVERRPDAERRDILAVMPEIGEGRGSGIHDFFPVSKKT
jgi:hypothetical protein